MMQKRRIAGWLMTFTLTVTAAAGSILPVQAAGTAEPTPAEEETASGETDTNRELAETGRTAEQPEENAVGMPNPFVDYDNLAEAQKAAGFELKLPLVAPAGYENPVYRVIPGEFLEVVWTNAEGDDFRFRKCPASGGDASGDYNDYAYNHTYRVGGMDLRVRGEKLSARGRLWPMEGQMKAQIVGMPGSSFNRIHVISTVVDGYSYAMTSSAGLTMPELLQIRRGFIEEWLPSALAGISAADAKVFMNSSGSELYDTGISLIYSDRLDPLHFFYIPLDENRNVVTVSYMVNEVYHLDQE